MGLDLPFEDSLDILNTQHTCTRALDTKDWALLKPPQKGLTQDHFVGLWSNKDTFGGKLFRVQHLMGSRHITVNANGSVTVEQQIRATHQMYTTPEHDKVWLKGAAGGVRYDAYVKEGGAWKLSTYATSKLEMLEDQLLETIVQPGAE